MITNLGLKNQCTLTNQQLQDWNLCLETIGVSRDKQAFAELFQHFAPMLKGFLLKDGNLTAEIAEDLIQETMVKVWRKSPSYKSSMSAASTWIYTIARNTRIDLYRKQRRENQELLRAEDLYIDQEAPSAFSSVSQARANDAIRTQLNALPTEQSEVIEQMYFRGRSGQEAAIALAIPLGTVKSRLRLALNKMRIIMQPELETDSEATS